MAPTHAPAFQATLAHASKHPKSPHRHRSHAFTVANTQGIASRVVEATRHKTLSIGRVVFDSTDPQAALLAAEHRTVFAQWKADTIFVSISRDASSAHSGGLPPAPVSVVRVGCYAANVDVAVVGAIVPVGGRRAAVGGSGSGTGSAGGATCGRGGKRRPAGGATTTSTTAATAVVNGTHTKASSLPPPSTHPTKALSSTKASLSSSSTQGYELVVALIVATSGGVALACLRSTSALSLHPPSEAPIVAFASVAGSNIPTIPVVPLTAATESTSSNDAAATAVLTAKGDFLASLHARTMQPGITCVAMDAQVVPTASLQLGQHHGQQQQQQQQVEVKLYCAIGATPSCALVTARVPASSLAASVTGVHAVHHSSLSSRLPECVCVSVLAGSCGGAAHISPSSNHVADAGGDSSSIGGGSDGATALFAFADGRVVSASTPTLPAADSSSSPSTPPQIAPDAASVPQIQHATVSRSTVVNAASPPLHLSLAWGPSPSGMIAGWVTGRGEVCIVDARSLAQLDLLRPSDLQQLEAAVAQLLGAIPGHAVRHYLAGPPVEFSLGCCGWDGAMRASVTEVGGASGDGSSGVCRSRDAGSSGARGGSASKSRTHSKASKSKEASSTPSSDGVVTATSTATLSPDGVTSGASSRSGVVIAIAFPGALLISVRKGDDFMVKIAERPSAFDLAHESVLLLLLLWCCLEDALLLV